ncbi:clarin-2 [Tachyglossus aculeatus]|uniref:clarin-2 n=1 Tax=Tachyglossus aculeatus TaxID=9261 RepID=UPI0018F75FAB|nr:clarin-2 [Tachyglossus aculeatus]
MPGCFKKTWFALASFLSFVSFVLIITAMAIPHWMSGKILCKTGVDLVNATDPELVKFIGDLYYGLFRGCKVRQCGLGGRRSTFTIFPHLVKSLNSGLHVMILLFLFVAMALALVSMGFGILNMVSVPYQAVNGPGGICLWNVLSGGFVSLAVTSFMAAVKFHRLTDRIANFQENVFQFVVVEEGYEESFWICVASATAHAANLLVIAISQIPLPEPKTKIEEVHVTAEDIMY